MSENSVMFESGGLKLEGLLDRARGDAGVVIAHPHPQYGGSMHNNVVESLVKAYGKAGFTTLRFNFRGVGRSEGHYDGGVGEQQDVSGAVAYLKDLGMTTIHLAGYFIRGLGKRTGTGRSRECDSNDYGVPAGKFHGLFLFSSHTPTQARYDRLTG